VTTPPALGAALDDLYNAFARYPLASKIEGCPHCVDASRESVLHSKRLRDLDSKDLGFFAFKAMTTFGAVEDFKHFLPRLLELLTVEPFLGAADLRVVLGKLVHGRWRGWIPAEQLAVERFLLALFEQAAAEPESLAVGVPEIVEAIHGMGTDSEGISLRPFLDVLALHTDALVAYVNDYSEKPPEVVAWLVGGGVRSQLERVFFERASAPGASEISEAVNAIDRLAQGRRLSG